MARLALCGLLEWQAGGSVEQRACRSFSCKAWLKCRADFRLAWDFQGTKDLGMWRHCQARGRPHPKEMRKSPEAVQLRTGRAQGVTVPAAPALI